MTHVLKQNINTNFVILILEHSSESLDLCFGTPEKFPPSPKKSRKMEDIESDDKHSSYAGSVRSDTEMSDTCEFSDEKNSETMYVFIVENRFFMKIVEFCF